MLERTDNDGVRYQGMDLTPGTWILFQQGPRPLKLVMITSIIWTASDCVQLKGMAYLPGVILQSDGLGGEYADVSRLQSDAQEIIIKSLCGAGVTVVLPIEHEGKVRFVEQP